MKEIRHSKEDAQSEAEKMQSLAGKNTTTEDYETAHQIVSENLPEAEHWDKLKKEYITIQPPIPGMNSLYGIEFNTDDRVLRKIFNIAAKEVTQKYGGFNQSGGLEDTGYTRWELWKWPNEIPPTKGVDEIYEKMREIAPKIEKWYEDE